MKKILNLFLWFPLAVIAIIFLVANREPVAVSLNPFADQSGYLTSPALPMWVWLMLMLFVGVALGSLGSWSSNAPNRRKAREMRQELKTVRRELATMREARPSGETLPVLKSE